MDGFLDEASTRGLWHVTETQLYTLRQEIPAQGLSPTPREQRLAQYNTSDYYKRLGRHFCSTCGKEYKWMQSLIRHEREECGKDPQYSCPVCGYIKSCRPHDYHRRYHGKYTCDACGKEYTWKPSLTRHKREECDYGKYKYGKFRYRQYHDKHICHACGKEYLWKGSLTRHKREECGRSKKPQVYHRRKYICDACKKVYTWRCSLRRHIREECGKERQFTCAPCDKRFKHKHHLKEHRMTQLHKQTVKRKSNSLRRRATN
ncbi:zinc finger protein 728-like [Cataglyphis hispanica]|uniref:zinc finger protein 728-like n=1 Tax=Cataglyphis hispanica TaxID=1086592 RepID=UPI00217F33C9|nr:zinc finger protein 728-like [Cataglyphis hispanica]